MRIVVANLTAGGLSGGYRRYLSRLMPLLANECRVTSLTILVPAGADAGLDPSLDVRTWPPRDAWQGYAVLAREVAALAPDVVFVPTARHVRVGRVPVVTMVRNMEPLTVPFGGHTLKEGLKNVVRRLEARRACRRAARVIAVSNHVRDFLVSRWHIRADHIGVAYHGVDHPDGGAPAPVSSDQSALLLTAGSIRPARGLEDAISALAFLGPDVRLVIAGQVDAGCERYAARLRRLAAALGVEGRVTWVGQLDPDEMVRAFRECAAFVMTSRAEACPNTALEAMSRGCASVAVDCAPMPEFFDDAALYYPRGDARALARQCRTVLDHLEIRMRLRFAACRRSSAFSWESTRDRTLQELELAIS